MEGALRMSRSFPVPKREHLNHMRWGKSLPVIDMAFASGANVQAIMPPLLRALTTQGEHMPVRGGTPKPFSQITFVLGRSHPVYDVLGKDLANKKEVPYAWYVRV